MISSLILSVLAIGHLSSQADALKTYTTYSPDKIPGYTDIYEIDTVDGSFKKIASDKTSRTAVSSATMCGGVYYNIWTDFGSHTAHILSVDIAGNATKTIQDFQTYSLFHALACDPNSPKDLIGVASDAGSSKPTFSLKRIQVSDSNESYVGTFPADELIWGGSDSIFSFNKDASEVWAAWPADICPDCSDAKKGGRIHVMDTTTGKIKQSLKLKPSSLIGKKASPYFVVPDANRGVFDTGDATLFWTDLDIEADENEMTYKTTKASAQAFWASSQPAKVCGDTVLALSQTTVGNIFSVSEVHAEDGSVVSSFDFSKINPPDGYWFSGVVCA